MATMLEPPLAASPSAPCQLPPHGVHLPSVVHTNPRERGGHGVAYPPCGVHPVQPGYRGVVNHNLGNGVHHARATGLLQRRQHRAGAAGARHLSGTCPDRTAIGRVRAQSEERGGGLAKVVGGHAVQWRHSVGVKRLDIRPKLHQGLYLVRPHATHATHVKRQRPACRLIVRQVRVLPQQLLQRQGALPKHRLDYGCVPPARVLWPGAGVVVLVLPPVGDVLQWGWVSILLSTTLLRRIGELALYGTPVYAWADSVAVGVEAFVVSPPRRPVLLGHAGCVGVMGDTDSVGAVVLLGLLTHRRGELPSVDAVVGPKRTEQRRRKVPQAHQTTLCEGNNKVQK
eukprot:Hpha_TRINITY_DN16179_c3_g9::TRINITY_DN16179_c3_g9_i2::g.8016::m.8016